MTEFKNNLTQYFDKYLVKNLVDINKRLGFEANSTYLWRNDVENAINCPKNDRHIAFRVPGATRGHIIVDKDLIIQEIVFYDDTCFCKEGCGSNCYEKEIVDEITHFIGAKLETRKKNEI